MAAVAFDRPVADAGPSARNVATGRAGRTGRSVMAGAIASLSAAVARGTRALSGRIVRGTIPATAPAARHDEAFYRQLAESSPDVIMQLDAVYRRTYVSPSSLEILGYPPGELIGGDARNVVHPDDWHRVAAARAALCGGAAQVGVAYRAIRKDRTTIWVEGLVRKLDGGGGVVTLRDITQRRLAEARLEQANRRLTQLATCDGLTGLLNRRGFDEALVREHRRAARLAAPLALLMIDVDHFKAYNDAYGHPAGDACLRMIAATIRRRLHRAGDEVARYGGEEFAIILPSTGVVYATMLADAIRCAVTDRDIPHHTSPAGTVTVSVGVASVVVGDDDCGPSQLVERADTALYAAKRAGRDTTQAFPAARRSPCARPAS